MSVFKARGIVIKEFFIGESDKIITLLVKEKGKISVSAKGARNQKSKFMAGTGLFCYSDFVIFEGRGFYSLTQCDLIESFYRLRNDIDKFYHASYFLELIDKTVLENMYSDEILLLLLRSLSVLSKDVLSPALIARIFEFKLLALSGFMPETKNCVYCRNELGCAEHFYFAHEGVVCSNCEGSEKGLIKISEATLYTLNYILSSDFDGLFKFNVSPAVIKQLTAMSEKFINEHLSLNLKTYAFISSSV